MTLGPSILTIGPYIVTIRLTTVAIGPSIMAIKATSACFISYNPPFSICRKLRFDVLVQPAEADAVRHPRPGLPLRQDHQARVVRV